MGKPATLAQHITEMARASRVARMPLGEGGRAVKAVGCPMCGAMRGARCVTRGARYMDRAVHRARLRALWASE